MDCNLERTVEKEVQFSPLKRVLLPIGLGAENDQHRHEECKWKMENHYLLQMVSHLFTGSKIVQLNMEIYYVELLHSAVSIYMRRGLLTD